MTLGEMLARPRNDRDATIVIVTMENIELAQHARDRAEERALVEMGLIDLGGEC